MSGIIIDTCIWSLALRGATAREKKVAEELSRLIDENRAKIIGPIRQEVLSGYSDHKAFTKLRNKLSHFPNESITDSDYEAAAEYSNLCRRHGVQGSQIDYLICAVAVRTKAKIYTKDKDFQHYAKHLSISLHE